MKILELLQDVRFNTFVLMSRYYLRFMDPRNSKELVAKSKEE